MLLDVPEFSIDDHRHVVSTIEYSDPHMPPAPAATSIAYAATISENTLFDSASKSTPHELPSLCMRAQFLFARDGRTRKETKRGRKDVVFSYLKFIYLQCNRGAHIVS